MPTYKHSVSQRSEEDISYPLTIAGIADAQQANPALKHLFNSLSAKFVLAGEKLVATYSIFT